MAAVGVSASACAERIGFRMCTRGKRALGALGRSQFRRPPLRSGIVRHIRGGASYPGFGKNQKWSLTTFSGQLTTFDRHHPSESEGSRGGPGCVKLCRDRLKVSVLEPKMPTALKEGGWSRNSSPGEWPTVDFGQSMQAGRGRRGRNCRNNDVVWRKESKHSNTIPLFSNTIPV